MGGRNSGRYNKDDPNRQFDKKDMNLRKDVMKAPTNYHARDDISKFLSSINAWKGSKKSSAHKTIPPVIQDLYSWFKGLRRKDIDYLLELRNIYDVLKSDIVTRVATKILEGGEPSKKDLDQIRLVKEILVDSHKLKFGDKKVIEQVTYHDVRKQIFSEEKTIKEGKFFDQANRRDNGRESSEESPEGQRKSGPEDQTDRSAVQQGKGKLESLFRPDDLGVQVPEG